MMSPKILVAAVAAGLLVGVICDASAQQQTIRKVVLQGQDPQPGGDSEPVSGVPAAAIPFTDASLDDKGNFVIDCVKTNGNCSNIGSGSGGAPAAPVITFNGPTGTVPASNVTERLHWTTTGAQSCYGKEAKKVGDSSYVVSGWTKDWALNTTASTGFQVGSLPRSQTTDTSYEFTLRCSSHETTMGGTPVVALRDEVKTVTLAKSETPVAGAYCAEYLADLQSNNPSEYQNYLNYLAHSAERNFTKVESTFVARTGKTLGVSTGAIIGGLPGLPPLNDMAYLALSFSFTEGQKGLIQFVPPVTADLAKPTDLAITISPCPGDFRPQSWTSSDTYVSSLSCRPSGLSGAFTGRPGTPTSGALCQVPVGKTIYLNISRQKRSMEPVPVPPAQPSPITPCETSNGNCGLGLVLNH